MSYNNKNSLDNKHQKYLSNADYHGELGLVIKQYHDKLVFSNPGILAMPLEQIMLGGESKQEIELSLTSSLL